MRLRMTECFYICQQHRAVGPSVPAGRKCCHHICFQEQAQQEAAPPVPGKLRAERYESKDAGSIHGAVPPHAPSPTPPQQQHISKYLILRSYKIPACGMKSHTWNCFSIPPCLHMNLKRSAVSFINTYLKLKATTQIDQH